MPGTSTCCKMDSLTDPQTLIVIFLLGVVLWLVYKIFVPEKVTPVADLTPKAKPPPPRDFTRAELDPFDGTNGKPIYLGCKDKVFDMSSKPSFYGPGGAYSAFAGRDASRALAKQSVDPNEANNPSLDGLTDSELSQLEEWYQFFCTRYPVVGYIVENKKPETPAASTEQQNDAGAKKND